MRRIPALVESVKFDAHIHRWLDSRSSDDVDSQ